MKIEIQEDIALNYNPDPKDQHRAGLSVEVLYLQKKHIPKYLMIRKWEKTESLQTANISQRPASLGMRYSIPLKRFTITFKEYEVALKFFDLLHTDFEGKELKEEIPEAFL